MEELKKHKSQDDILKKIHPAHETVATASEEEGSDVDEGDAVEEVVVKRVKKHTRSKKTMDEKEEKRGPAIGDKLKVAAHVSMSTAERIINGLTNAYQNVFVAPEATKESFLKEQGYKYFEKGDFEKAKDNFLEYLETGKENDADVIYMIALCHKNLDEYKEALEYLKKAEKLEGDDPNIVSELGDCLVTLEDYSEAIVYLLKAAEINPDHADIFYHLGTCYEKTEQVEKAKEFYKKAIDLEPREAVYYQALGFLYESTGNHKDAIVCFKKAMDMEKGKKQRGGAKQ
ncbi:MAG: tetratricopeptide repeat protein [Candidatus Omnitrophica bacterium]|nr:tetratricopeptide repeat protein [Candidatus Omnitrophota bacterium]